jgi:hypothetical protein
VHLPSPDENGSRASGSLRLIDERCEGPDGSPLRVFACLLGGFFFGLRVCLFRAVRLRLVRLFLSPFAVPSVRPPFHLLLRVLRSFVRLSAARRRCAGD